MRNHQSGKINPFIMLSSSSLQPQRKSTKRRPPFLLLLVLFFLPMLACSLCDDIRSGSGAPFERILGCDLSDEIVTDRVSIFPVVYSGMSAIKTSSQCDKQGNTSFVVNEDYSCVLTVTFQHAFLNTDGSCQKSEDTDAWLAYGTFDVTQQVCKFKYCNLESSFSAKGSMAFSSSQAYPVSDVIICQWKDSGEVGIEIDPGTLYPSTP
jgi:hypothetical protein